MTGTYLIVLWVTGQSPSSLSLDDIRISTLGSSLTFLLQNVHMSNNYLECIFSKLNSYNQFSNCNPKTNQAGIRCQLRVIRRRGEQRASGTSVHNSDRSACGSAAYGLAVVIPAPESMSVPIYYCF